jgi:hypothetical protein
MGAFDEGGIDSCIAQPTEFHLVPVEWPVCPSYLVVHLTEKYLLYFDNRCRTIADRILGLRLVPSRALLNRNVSYEFMNRQMVWHAFTVRPS